jgi:hypothetical protein
MQHAWLLILLWIISSLDVIEKLYTGRRLCLYGIVKYAVYNLTQNGRVVFNRRDLKMWDSKATTTAKT